MLEGFVMLFANLSLFIMVIVGGSSQILRDLGQANTFEFGIREG